MRKNKIWYEIIIKCIDNNNTLSMEIGDSETIARVKSYGLAYLLAMEVSEIYGGAVTVSIK